MAGRRPRGGPARGPPRGSPRPGGPVLPGRLGGGRAARRALAARQPTLAAAHALHRDGAGPARAAVEARVLADEPPARIAAAGGFGPGVVEAYEAVFFDVRRGLDHPDYIRTRVLGPPPAVRGPGAGPGSAWRWLGYLGGPAVLDVLIGGTTGPPPAVTGGVDAFLAAEAAATARRRLALAAWGDGDPAALAGLLRAAAAAAGGAAPLSGIETHVNAMLAEIPWAFGSVGPAAERPDLAPYDALAAELRDEEVLRVASGFAPPGLEVLADLTLPPPRKRGSLLMGPGKAAAAGDPGPVSARPPKSP